MGKKAVKVRVEGFVQGVYFRASLASTASDLGVSGWVRNMPDGSVEAFLEGDDGAVDGAVDGVVEWARKGTSRSRVESVSVEIARPMNFRGFKIVG
jgi:acylphosphatase